MITWGKYVAMTRMLKYSIFDDWDEKHKKNPIPGDKNKYFEVKKDEK